MFAAAPESQTPAQLTFTEPCLFTLFYSSPEFTHFEIVPELHVSVCAELRENQKLGRLYRLIRKRRIHFCPSPCLQVPPSRALAAAHAPATPMPPWWTESPDGHREGEYGAAPARRPCFGRPTRKEERPQARWFV